jgi:hypothetical protein
MAEPVEVVAARLERKDALIAAVEREIVNAQREAAQVRRAYLHEMALKEAAEATLAAQAEQIRRLEERLAHVEPDGYGRAANEEAGRLEAEAKLAEARSEIQRLGQDVFKSQQRRARAAQLRKRMLRQHVGYLNQIREAEAREKAPTEARLAGLRDAARRVLIVLSCDYTSVPRKIILNDLYHAQLELAHAIEQTERDLA